MYAIRSYYGPVALPLVGVDDAGGYAGQVEGLGDAVGAVLGPREHDGPGDAELLDQVDEQVALAALLDVVQALRYQLDGRLLRLYRNNFV